MPMERQRVPMVGPSFAGIDCSTVLRTGSLLLEHGFDELTDVGFGDIESWMVSAVTF